MPDVVRLTAADFDEAMDFMNMVFSMSGGATDFQRLLPKVYQPDDRLMQAHYAIRRAGRIRAVVGAYPMTLQAGPAEWSINGIGGVCTHPGEQKSGLMRQLMTAVLADMEREGCVLSILGGQRQRYGYFGYEKAGTSLSFQISKTNLRHFFRGQNQVEFRFIRVSPDHLLHDPQQADQIRQWQALMKSWHDRQPIHILRPEADFLTVLSSWYARIWLAEDLAGQPAGYLVTDRDGLIVKELIAASADRVFPIAVSWIERQPTDSVTFTLPPWNLEAIAFFGRVCENCSVSSAGNYRINNWPALLSSLLLVKGGQQPLPDGVLHLGVEDPGAIKVYELAWQAGRADCRETPAAGADLLLDRLTATRLVLGPLTPMQVAPQIAAIKPEISRLLSSWFPLPLAWPSPDGV